MSNPEEILRWDERTQRVVREPVVVKDLGGHHCYVDDDGLVVRERLAPGEVFSGERRPRCNALLTHEHGRSLCHRATGHPLPHEATCVCDEEWNEIAELAWTADGEDWTTRKEHSD